MTVKIKKGELYISKGKVIGHYSTTVTKIGTSAKISCPKRFLNHDAVVILLEKGEMK